ncbi:MAG TPA: acyltransferase family protein [Planctomycetaceae bacterium]|nr:acyltransferase family protein [Planctomycetaceae bacterium]
MQSDRPAALGPRNITGAVRLTGLDTLRGLAAVAVVLLHAGIPYMRQPLSHLVWPVTDGCPCPLVDALAWWIEGFIMPLFFLLAGFFSAGLLAASGPQAFLSHRTKRILWPLLAACVVILPPCIYLWALGWVAEGVFVPRSILMPGFPRELKAELYGTAHLWFLQYLYIYCLVLCGGSYLRRRFSAFDAAAQICSSRIGWRLKRLMLSAWKPLLPAIPCALILFWDPRIVVGFYQTFLPVASKLLYYSIYYFTGVLVYRQHRCVRMQARYGKQFLTAAIAVFALALPLIHQHRSAELTGAWRALMAALLAAFAWLTAFGLFGIFLAAKRGCNSATRYLADSSYWIYLIHLPFVALAHISIARLPILTPAKFVLSATIAVGLSLMTYHAFVRYTWLGEALNGCRRKRGASVKPRLELAPAAVAAVRQFVAAEQGFAGDHRDVA